MFYLNDSGTVELTCKLITLGCIWLKDMLGEQKAKMKKVRIRSKYTFGPVIYFNLFILFFCFYYFALNPNFILIYLVFFVYTFFNSYLPLREIPLVERSSKI